MISISGRRLCALAVLVLSCSPRDARTFDIAEPADEFQGTTWHVALNGRRNEVGLAISRIPAWLCRSSRARVVVRQCSGAGCGARGIARIAADANAFLASLIDREAAGDPVTLPDGTKVRGFQVFAGGCGTANSVAALERWCSYRGIDYPTGLDGKRELRYRVHIDGVA